MALAVDAGSSPAVVSAAATTVTTASFTRPAAGSLLVATVMGTSDAAPSVSSSAGLTWTRQRQQISGTSYAELWTAPVTGTGAMTVTATVTGSQKKLGLKVDGLTGQHPSSPIGATNGGTSTANTLDLTTAYTSLSSGSRGFLAALDGSGGAAPTVGLGDTGSPWSATQLGTIGGIAIRKAANTSTAGESVPFQSDAAGTGAGVWTWAALEIKAASLDAAVVTTTLAVATAMPAPAVSAGAGATPAAIAAVTAMPAPAVSTGAGATPAAIAAAVAMPPPSVATQNVSPAIAGTIAAVTAMPAPAVSADSHAAPATIAAAVAMPPPTVRVDADVHLSTIAVAVAMTTPVVAVPPLPGDRITQAGQIEWDGFLLGAGSPYAWQELEGWRSSAPWISGNVDQSLGPGSYPGEPSAGERVINWSMLTRARRSQIAQVLRDLQMATGRAQTEDEGALVIWDLDYGEPCLVYGHLSNREPGPINLQARHGLMRGALQWTCSDPAIYSVIRQSAPIAKDVETDILNDGNEAATRVIIRIPGPCTTPQIENVTLDRVIAFDIDVLAGQTLEIDIRNGNVVVGVTDLLNTLIEGSTSVKDFVLGAGANRLIWSAATGGTVMDVLWRHAST